MSTNDKAMALALKEEGNRLFKSRDFEKAAEKYEEAIALDPTNPIFLSNYCNALFQLERFDAVEVASKKCIDLDATCVKGYYWLAKAYVARKMNDEAIETCEKALQIDPNQAEMQKMHQILNNAKTDIASSLMESCNLEPAKDSLGNTILVSSGLASTKYQAANGSIDLGKVLNTPRRGACAYPACRTSKSDDDNLMRCSRCWQVDYCSKECQRADWKRHKSEECKERERDVEKKTDVSWQAVVYDGRCAMKQKEFDKAISSFLNVVKSRMMHSLLVHVASCYLKKGDAKTGLNYAYNACQSAYEDLQSMVVKARCHRKLGDLEAAYYCAYTAYNSNIPEKDKVEATLMPLIQELTTELVSHLQRKYTLSQSSSFPMKIHISSVPFTLDYKNGQVGILQDRNGSGFHICRPQTDSPSFGTLQQHTAVTYGKNIIVFGGIDALNDITNQVRIFHINEDNEYTYHVQTCTGEVPRPVQGHAACVVSDKMYVYGGSPYLEDLYELDLLKWNWRRLTSMTMTKQEDKPEVDVVFPSLVKFDSETLLLLGGMRGEEQRASLAKGAIRGFTVQQGKIDPSSKNKHLYSLRTGKWRFIGHDPCGWELHAHNIDEKKVLVLSGQPNYALTNTYMYIVSEKADGSVEWVKVDESSNGMPPSTAVFRGSTWIASANSLFLYGGRYNYIKIHDSVFKQRNSDQDTTHGLLYDTEVYCFNLELKQWIRLRIETSHNSRNSHTMNEIDGKLVVLGGSRVASGIKGYRDEREYTTEVLAYDLDLSLFQFDSQKSKAKKTKHLKKGKKGKKTRR